jgi:hypothetical protein
MFWRGRRATRPWTVRARARARAALDRLTVLVRPPEEDAVEVRPKAVQNVANDGEGGAPGARHPGEVRVGAPASGWLVER